MKINPKKSAVMSFHQGQIPFLFDCTFKNGRIAHVSRLKDLGVVFFPSLNPAEHIASVLSSASSLLSFVCRSSRDLISPATLLTLYKALVCEIMEYAQVLWTP